MRGWVAVLAFAVLAGCGTKRQPVEFTDLGPDAQVTAYCRDAKPILDARCTACHSPTAPSRNGAPAGVDYHTFEAAKANGERGLVRVEAGEMPPGGMPDGEKAVIRAWVNGGLADCPAVPDVPGDGGEGRDDLADPAGDPGWPDPGPVESGPNGTTWCEARPAFLASCATAGCHSGGTPAALLDLSDPAKAAAMASKIAQRLGNGTMPPYGSPAPSAGDKALMLAWVSEGARPCEVVGDDGGPVDFGPFDPGPIVPTCTSEQKAVYTLEGGDNMNPGMNCIQCHLQPKEPGEDLPPAFPTAGTVMLGLHDEDLCYGAAGVQVEVRDATGTVRFAMTTGPTGNFHVHDEGVGMPSPYTAAVLRKGQVVAEMKTPQTNPNCMDCHTWDGANGAPGRIWAP